MEVVVGGYNEMWWYNSMRSHNLSNLAKKRMLRVRGNQVRTEEQIIRLIKDDASAKDGACNISNSIQNHVLSIELEGDNFIFMLV